MSTAGGAVCWDSCASCCGVAGAPPALPQPSAAGMSSLVEMGFFSHCMSGEASQVLVGNEKKAQA